MIFELFIEVMVIIVNLAYNIFLYLVTGPLGTIKILLMLIMLLIGSLPARLTDPPLRPTPVQVVSLGCETIEAPVRVSGIDMVLMSWCCVFEFPRLFPMVKSIR